MNFSFQPKLLPPIADDGARARGFERWLERAGELADNDTAHRMQAIPGDFMAAALFSSVFGNSPFLTHCILSDPAFALDLLELGPDRAFARLQDDVWQRLDQETDLPKLMQHLRLAKRQVALLVAVADITGSWELDQVTGTLSDFAQMAVRLAVRFLLRREAAKGEFTLPNPADPEQQSGLVVLGMGKFGARELNYSSDIDLIVFYDHEKLDYRGRHSLPECMIRLVRDLVKILDERTVHGYVFRTDLRLRPDPGSTPVAISLVAAENYYEGFGQNWERAAMIKARQVAGDDQTGSAFLKFLRPFIWRKSLDFAAIQDIHSIKRQINAHRGGHKIAVAGHNIKLGRGGIREIEFFAQTQQLIWGGRQTALRCIRTLDALDALVSQGHVDAQAAAELADSYRFLRRLEHRLQMVDDKQTQTLPDTPERLLALARFMGFTDSDGFAQTVLSHLGLVEDHYAHLFEESPQLAPCGNLVFTGGDNDPDTVQTLTGMGFSNAAAICETIRGWHHGRIRATRSTRARELLTELTPALLSALSGTATPMEAFLRFDGFLSALPAGIPLFSLFHSNPALLDLVAEIMGNAPALADLLARRSTLLDAVLAHDFFAPPPDADVMAAELSDHLAEAADPQEMLDLTRRWAGDVRFRIGVQSLRNLLPPIQAQAAFTHLADAVLTALAPKVQHFLAQTHGTVPGAEWCVLAMGKMGGGEMTATSDLDLILIYDAPAGVDESDGRTPLSTATWFARLTQRLVNALTAKTAEGGLYEVDMRLRPSGNAGPIAARWEAFERYQHKDAWTWEHMALTRARVVSGSPTLAGRVRDLIQTVLCRPRDPDTLLADVADMRRRMAREHKPGNPWDVKHRLGGLVDIEFTAQYLQLRWAATHPDVLAQNTRQTLDNAMKADILAPSDRDQLVEAWGLWSAIQTVLRQTIAGSFDADAAPAGLKAILVAAAGYADFKTLCDKANDCAQAAHDVYERIVGQPGRLIHDQRAAQEQAP